MECYTDRYGRLVQEYGFDAWGNLRNANGSSANLIKPIYDRGFTGHEHHYDFGLINMNGRMYDPYTSMFLSPDNYIQAPDNSQSFNRYAYCLNNPLKYTDPSGEFWHIVIGAAVGGISNLAFNWNNCDGFWEYATAFAVGAGSGALTALTGGAGTSILAVSGVAAAGGALTSATNSMIAQTGKNFSGINSVSWDQVTSSAVIGGASSFVGGIAGGYAGTHIGGVMINGLNITSPVVKGIVAGSIGGMVGGATAGYVGGYMTTGSSEEAFNSALSGMWQGSVLGGVSGGIGAYAAAKNAKINPWTGVHNKSAVLGESMSERIIPVSKDLQAEYLSAPEMDNAYFGREISQNTTYTNKISMEFNAQWIESKMAQNYHLYDIGPVGNKVVSPYYNMEQCRTMYYPNIHKTHYSSISIYNIQIRIIIWK
ncbi:MAG: hypothetical protein IJZ87_04020 [Bacteroidales bacterium]|nr:hypothetical protein [Bacteroidales bacterium]